MITYCAWCGGDLDDEEVFGIGEECCSEECAEAVEDEESIDDASSSWS